MVTRWNYLNHDGPIAIAHRGGAAEATENTMDAFVAAVEMGYRYLETDVYLTSDKVLVAFHDRSLERLCGISEDITKLAWRDLTTLRVSGAHVIPQFVEVLEAWPEVKIAVDPKHYAATAPLVGLLQQTNSIGRACIGSFSRRRLQLARRLGGPQLCTGMSPVEIAQLQAAGAGLRLRNPSGACAQVPPVAKGVPIVNRRFVQAAHTYGVAVLVWTIDEPQQMHRLLDMGVDGIMTDRPGLLKEVLIARGSWM
ncbi:MAG: glycerophosphodiester phosphodiesterase family protein [bacterium]|nr:glycerophosphodiester phosphodiesterase family protein [bacterium]